MFYWIINKLLDMTITSSILIVSIIIIKKLFHKKLSVKWNYYVWLLIVIQLLIPISLKSGFSIYNLLTFNTLDNSTYLYNDYNKPINTYNSKENSLDIDTKLYEPYKHTKVLQIENLIYIIWLTGFITLTLYYLILNLKLLYRFRKCNCNNPRLENLFMNCKSLIVPTKNVKLLVSDFISVPSLYGIIHPIIIMPKSILTNKSEKEIELLLIHELMHLKLRHNVIKGIYLLLIPIYWFNPLIWLGLRRIDEDGELYCDQTVVNSISSTDNIIYGNLIIDLASYNQDFSLPIQAVSFMSNKKSIEKRILNITSNKSKNLKTRIIGCLIIFIMALTLMTSAKTNASLLTNRIEQETGIILINEAKSIINVLDKADGTYISTTHTNNDILIECNYRTNSLENHDNLFSFRLININGIPKKCIIYINQLGISGTRRHSISLLTDTLESLFNNNEITKFIVKRLSIREFQTMENTIIKGYKINHIMDGSHKFYISWK